MFGKRGDNEMMYIVAAIVIIVTVVLLAMLAPKLLASAKNYFPSIPGVGN